MVARYKMTEVTRTPITADLQQIFQHVRSQNELAGHEC
jgi:hypothetical protein